MTIVNYEIREIDEILKKLKRIIEINYKLW